MILPVLACGLVAGLLQIDAGEEPASKQLVQTRPDWQALFVHRILAEHDLIADALRAQVVDVSHLHQEIESLVRVGDADVDQRLTEHAKRSRNSFSLRAVGSSLALLVSANSEHAHACSIGQIRLREPCSHSQPLQGLP